MPTRKVYANKNSLANKRRLRKSDNSNILRHVGT